MCHMRNLIVVLTNNSSTILSMSKVTYDDYFDKLSESTARCDGRLGCVCDVRVSFVMVNATKSLCQKPAFCRFFILLYFFCVL